MKKKTILIAAICLAVGVLIGFFIGKVPSKGTIRSEKTAQTSSTESVLFNSAQAFQTYQDNGVQFEQKYMNKRFYFEGEVISISKNTVSIYDPSSFSNNDNGVSLTFEVSDENSDFVASLSAGDRIRAEGTLNSFYLGDFARFKDCEFSYCDD